QCERQPAQKRSHLVPELILRACDDDGAEEELLRRELEWLRDGYELAVIAWRRELELHGLPVFELLERHIPSREVGEVRDLVREEADPGRRGNVVEAVAGRPLEIRGTHPALPRSERP